MNHFTFDTIWNHLYAHGRHLNLYPFDCVVAFVFRHRPLNKVPQETKILEIGCGSGNNLWFAARQGFQTYGIDGAPAAIEFARQRFEQDELTGVFEVGDFTNLPFENESFDLCIERGALVCTTNTGVRQAIGEVHRVLRNGGRFFCNLYSDRHSSARSGQAGTDGTRIDIKEGSLTGVGQLSFFGRGELDALFAGWRWLECQHVEAADILGPQTTLHSEWRLVLEKAVGSDS